ncbi:MAG: AbgT family transporter [Planctomycetes bacterium]|nr:AbgT family transporter [Planctomycetota bacterium]
MSHPATPPDTSPGRPARGAMDRFLAVVERGGNALPHPGTLFLLFALATLVLSDLAARFGLSATHPKTGKLEVPLSLLSTEGLHLILQKTVSNFTSFAPLGTVLVALLGIGIAESSGLIGVAMRKLVLSAPRKLLTMVVVFAGVLSNMASEIGYVLLIPLAALIFQAAGRHPIAGMAAAFAGVSGGYSANLLLGTVDPLLSGLTQEAARIVQPDALVNPACNYYFMFGSTFLLTLIGTLVTERVVEPRLGRFEDRGAGAGASGGAMQGAADALRPLDARERRGLLAAFAALAVLTALVLWGTLPADGFLRDPKTGDLLHSPFMSGIVPLIFLAGGLAGLAYGIAARTIRNDGDVMAGMAKSMQTLGGYLVLVFFAAQFVAYFNWSNLGLILAVKGAEALKASGLGGTPVLVAFIFLTGAVNLFMGSASAKWALMAPVFVPMFLLLGYPPEVTQCAYRIGDSCTNVISPMMTYFALIIAFFQRYQPSAGIGTLVATMLPYSVSFLLSWSLVFAIWMAAGWPLGPGGTP